MTPQRPRLKPWLFVAVAGAALLCAAMSSATEPLPTPAAGAARLATIDVTGEQPGPGLWRVQKDDHVLWLVGTLSPVPKAIEWKSAELQARLAEAHAIVGAPGVSVQTNRSAVGNLLLVPSALGARRNPDGATLQDLLPPDLYRRWAGLKASYIGRDRSIERWRPIFAAHRLHRKAADRSGLRFGSPAAVLIEATAKKRRLPVIDARVALTIDDPRVALREFKRDGLDDIECFERTLQRLETDLDLLRARANAWAIGDLDALRALRTADPASACIAAMLNSTALQKRGLDRLEPRVRAGWLAAAEQALDAHPVSVGQLSIGDLLQPDGYLAELRARGYRVTAPDEDDEEDAARFETDAGAQPARPGD